MATNAATMAGRRPAVAGVPVALLAALAGGGCGGEKAGTDGRSPIHAPMYHRPDAAQCAAPRPPGSCPGVGSDCASDSDCTDGGANGRCSRNGIQSAGCTCTYDACQKDTDCAAGQLCVCHDSPYSWRGNSCMAGNCRVDEDCGPGGYCSPAPGVRCAAVS